MLVCVCLWVCVCGSGGAPNVPVCVRPTDLTEVLLYQVSISNSRVLPPDNETVALIYQCCIETCTDQSVGVMGWKDVNVIHEKFKYSWSHHMNQGVLINAAAETNCWRSELIRMHYVEGAKNNVVWRKTAARVELLWTSEHAAPMMLRSMVTHIRALLKTALLLCGGFTSYYSNYTNI